MLRLAVCDDNIDELSRTAQLIDLYRAQKNIHCEYTAFSNGFELIAALEKGNRFDIYCLDILMPGFTGIEVAKESRADCILYHIA
jgi:CheY-like chemotaxis protein